MRLSKPMKRKEQRRAGALTPPAPSREKSRRRCLANEQLRQPRNPSPAAAFPDGRARDGPARLLPEGTFKGPSSSPHRLWSCGRGPCASRFAASGLQSARFTFLITPVGGNSWAEANWA